MNVEKRARRRGAGDGTTTRNDTAHGRQRQNWSDSRLPKQTHHTHRLRRRVWVVVVQIHRPDAVHLAYKELHIQRGERDVCRGEGEKLKQPLLSMYILLSSASCSLVARHAFPLHRLSAPTTEHHIIPPLPALFRCYALQPHLSTTHLPCIKQSILVVFLDSLDREHTCR